MNGCILNNNYVGGTLISGPRSYELRAIRASTRLVQTKDISDADFQALVNKAREMVQGSDAKRSGLDREEPEYHIPETKYRAFQITGGSDVFNLIQSDSKVRSVDKLEPADQAQRAVRILQ